MGERDWTEPLLATEGESLWAALHDGGVLRLDSDRMARALSLRVELGFPEPPKPCPETVDLRFAGVTHALLFTYWNWPGSYPRMVIPLAAESKTADEEYRRKARVETSDLDFLNQRLAEETQVEIMDAQLYWVEGGLTLVFDGTANDPESASGWQLRVAAQTLDVLQPDGSPLGLEELLRLGKAGWDAWKKVSADGRAAG